MRGGDEQRESRDWIYVVPSVVVRRNVRVLYLRLCVCVLYTPVRVLSALQRLLSDHKRDASCVCVCVCLCVYVCVSCVIPAPDFPTVKFRRTTDKIQQYIGSILIR